MPFGTGHQELPHTSRPCPPGRRPNQRPVSGTKARDFLKTQGHRAVRKRLGAVHGGAAPGHAEPPAPRPLARRGSLQTPERRDSLQAHQLRDKAAARRWLTHQKVSLKGSSHLWAALAARSRSQDRKPRCWRCAWDGRSVAPLRDGGGCQGREERVCG